MKTYSIPADRTWPPALDYAFLRREGLKHIEQLASDLWTDYNAHDPGITILEALCYAITELGYRSSFEMKHLLYGATDQVLYPAQQILTNHPFTVSDYRKLLIDLDGINNAWLFPSGQQEVPIYYDTATKRLQLEVSDTPIKINGLYEVVLDFAADDVFGDMNTGDIEVAEPEGNYVVRFNLPRYGEVESAVIGLEPASVTAVAGGADGPHELVLTDSDSNEYRVPFNLAVAQHPHNRRITAAELVALLGNGDFCYQVADTYLRKIKQINGIFREVVRQLHAHRNLCEDFVSIRQVPYEEIAFCMDIDVAADVDIDRVQAAVFFAIERYLSPSVNFYSLKELIDRGWQLSDIYNGVALQNGFIDPEELRETQLRTHIHASDLINLLMDIEGVTAIRNLVMTKYGRDGKPVEGYTGRDWCMAISPSHKPVLSGARSKVVLYKNGYPFHARMDEVNDTLLVLKAQHTLGKQKGHDAELTPEEGRARDTLSYWPVQYDLPAVYGVGEAGLPAEADRLRRAQQRQLKGYLLFFEQLLADFFAQLTNAARLFSVEDIRQTYFAQFLAGIKDTEGLLSDKLKKAIEDGPDSQEWHELYERHTQFVDRRNRFLDHLLARFAESFNDFALLRYQINYELQTAERIDEEELLAAKIQTLKQYPDISANRSKGFNYFPQTEAFELDEDQLWDTDNVSGLEKRIAALTGIQQVKRRYLYCVRNAEIRSATETVEDEVQCVYWLELVSHDGIVLLSPKFPSREEAQSALIGILEAAPVAENYGIAAGKIVLSSADQVLLESRDTVEPADADALMHRLAEEFAKPCEDPEGLHLIEHILLRPRTGDFKLMELCGEEDCPCERDPYSFRCSVVMPYWPDHFDHPAFRAFVEKKFQEEAPAHIQIKVCWVSNEQLREFEVCYHGWIVALAQAARDGDTALPLLQHANDRLLALLPTLKNVHPEATLHNCAESNIESNPVMLGRTVLGTYLNQ